MEKTFKELPFLKLDENDDYQVTKDEYSFRPYIYYYKDHFEIDWLLGNSNLWELNVIGNSIEDVINNAYNRCKQLNLIK